MAERLVFRPSHPTQLHHTLPTRVYLRGRLQLDITVELGANTGSRDHAGSLLLWHWDS